MHKISKIAQIGKNCVACGCCMKVCPKGAIHIELGIIAKVNKDACIVVENAPENVPPELFSSQNGR